MEINVEDYTDLVEQSLKYEILTQALFDNVILNYTGEQLAWVNGVNTVLGALESFRTKSTINRLQEQEKEKKEDGANNANE